MRSGDFGAALEIYRQLQKLMPDDPTWPERCAGAYQEMGQRRDALACLRRALDLQVDAGQVLAAITTCKLILDIDPDHPATLECLHLLYTEPSMNPGENVPPLIQTESPDDPAALDSATHRPGGDAPLLELELTDVIPGAHAVQLADAERGRVTEIPLEESHSGLSPSAPLDLRLEEKPAARRASRRARSAAPARATEPSSRTKLRSAREALAATPLFGSLDPDTLRRLMSQVRVVRLEAGEILFREGDPADTLYVVVDGAVVPIAEEPTRKRLAVLEKGAFFGEIGLVANQPRNATIEALVESRLLAIDRKVIWSIIRARPKISKILLRFLRERLIDRHIRTSPFFAAFARAERSDVAREFRFLEIRGDTRVVEQGKPAEGLFVLLAGQMQRVDDESDKVLGNLLPGDLFGAAPLPGTDPAGSSVVADGKCWVLVLDGPRLRRILQANPRLEGLLARTARRTGGEHPLA